MFKVVCNVSAEHRRHLHVHPSVAATTENIGLVYDKTGERSVRLKCCSQRQRRFAAQNLAPGHPLTEKFERLAAKQKEEQRRGGQSNFT